MGMYCPCIFNGEISWCADFSIVNSQPFNNLLLYIKFKFYGDYTAWPLRVITSGSRAALFEP